MLAWIKFSWFWSNWAHFGRLGASLAPKFRFLRPRAGTIKSTPTRFLPSPIPIDPEKGSVDPSARPGRTSPNTRPQAGIARDLTLVAHTFVLALQRSDCARSTGPEAASDASSQACLRTPRADSRTARLEAPGPQLPSARSRRVAAKARRAFTPPPSAAVGEPHWLADRTLGARCSARIQNSCLGLAALGQHLGSSTLGTAACGGYWLIDEPRAFAGISPWARALTVARYRAFLARLGPSPGPRLVDRGARRAA